MTTTGPGSLPANTGHICIPAEVRLRVMGWDFDAAVWNDERGAAILIRNGKRAFAVWREENHPWVVEVASLEELADIVEHVIPKPRPDEDLTFASFRCIPRADLRGLN